LEPGVAAAHHEHGPVGNICRCAVTGAMRLEDLGREPVGGLRHQRCLKRPSGDDDVVGRDPPVVHLREKPTVLKRKTSHFAVQFDRKLERRRVLLQVGDYLVSCRVAVRVTRKWNSRQAVVAPRREQR
jgi:hypothetical protein